MRYEIRKVIHTERGESVAMQGGYVIAPDWDTAAKQAIDAGLVQASDTFYAIPAFGMVPIKRIEAKLDTQPFDTLEQLQNFVYEHMAGSSISASHDGICASSLQHGSFRGYVAHYGPNSRYAWRYGLDGSITQEDRSR